MLIAQLNRTDAERIQLVFTNVDGGGSVTTGMGVCLVQTGASIDGVSGVKSTLANWGGFIGVSSSDIAINGYGLATAWGIAASVALSNVGTSITVTRGDYLTASAVAGLFFSSITPQALSTQLYRYLFAATTIPVDISNLAQSYVRAMVRAV